MQLQNSINIILFMPVQLNALIGLHLLLPMCCIGDYIQFCSPLICRNDYYLVCNLYECIWIFRGRISLVKDPSVLPHINCGPSARLLSCRNHKGGPERKYKLRQRPDFPPSFIINFVRKRVDPGEFFPRTRDARSLMPHCLPYQRK